MCRDDFENDDVLFQGDTFNFTEEEKRILWNRQCAIQEHNQELDLNSLDEDFNE